MKRLKHSKYKNTGVIFEILTRYIVREALANKHSTALQLIKKHFRDGTEMGKELKHYHMLNDVNPTIKGVDKLIDIVVESHANKIDSKKLSIEKYNLIGEIRKHYDIDKFFTDRVGNYKVLASIYKLFEHTPSENPSEYVNCRDVISEHISGASQVDNILTESQSTWKVESPDVRKLAYKILVEKFNGKYQRLSKKQKYLLSRFINEDISTDKFRDYVYAEVRGVTESILRKIRNIDSKVMQIKLDEVVSLSELITSSKVIKTEHLSALLKYYELDKEL